MGDGMKMLEQHPDDPRSGKDWVWDLQAYGFCTTCGVVPHEETTTVEGKTMVTLVCECSDRQEA